MATAAGNPAATGLPSFDVGESDDFVEYWVHLELPSSETADGTLLRSALQAQCALCLDFVAQWTRSYIWQRDPFVLVPCPAAGTDGRPAPCLYGRSYWGENIDDEWYRVAAAADDQALAERGRQRGGQRRPVLAHRGLRSDPTLD